MWMSTRATALALLVLVLCACAADEDLAGTLVRSGSGAAQQDGATPGPTADPSARPAEQPVLAGLVIVPDSLQLSSDPAEPFSARSRTLTVMARMSTGQQYPTSVTWQAAPDGLVSIGAFNALSTVPGTGGGLVTLVASSGSVSATASVRVVPRVLSVSQVSLSETAFSLDAPSAAGGRLSHLSYDRRLFAIVTMSDASTTTDVSWSSSDEAVAGVDASGLVTARGAGSAEIVARASQAPAILARCQVTVKASGQVDMSLE